MQIFNFIEPTDLEYLDDKQNRTNYDLFHKSQKFTHYKDGLQQQLYSEWNKFLKIWQIKQACMCFTDGSSS